MSAPFKLEDHPITPHQRTTLFVQKSDGMYAGQTDWHPDSQFLKMFEEMEQSGDYTVIDLFTPVGEGVPAIHGVRLR